ncbi:MAG: diaminopimelate decarboxylase [Solobacterium sp.]|nr:diaminopimelate decarboxylase [Solobacterium sp.]
MICENLTNENGILHIGGVSVKDLVEEYGTGLYIMDEDRIRTKCRMYTQAMKKYFAGKAMACYASKAASFKRIYQIVSEEGMGVDVVSSGEIYTALKAGISLDHAAFHSNNKTDWDIRFAMENNIGYFVVDNREELDAINAVAKEMGKVQNILLRLTPGIDPHTFAAVATGKVDSKFGTSIETGQAKEQTDYALSLKNIHLTGFHCHVGSQVFDSDVFIDAAKIMLAFIAEVKKDLGFEASVLDLGGGFGVRYTEDDPYLDIDTEISRLADVIHGECAKHSLEVPEIWMEPGRSIVADAGITVYTVGTVKRIPGYKNYVSIDGGMTDNPRYALYRSRYTVLAAEKLDEPCDFRCSLVGRCCESGDIIQEDILLPSSVQRGDLIAVCTTGAYNYAMASNYNRIARLPIVMVKDGKSYLAVRRESLEDIVRNDV